MSDEDDIADDAMRDEADEQSYKRFRRDHEDEIADEITTGEVLSAIAAAHTEWWERTEAEIAKAHRRIADGEPDEALFHVGRAFDGYIKNVLVAPLKGAVAERFERFMPSGFPIKEDSIFKSVTGLGNAAAFAEYSVSLVVKKIEDAEAIIKAMRKLINGGGPEPTWRERDRAFHAPIEVKQDLATALLAAAESILGDIVRHVAVRVEEDSAARERREFSRARIEILRDLSQAFDVDAESLVNELELRLSYDAMEEAAEALWALTALGHIERFEYEDPEWPFSRHELLVRLTSQGRNYYEEKVAPRMIHGAG